MSNDNQQKVNEHAAYLAYLSKQKRASSPSFRYRHTLSPMSMVDIAQAIGIEVSTLYRWLQKESISPKKVKAMLLTELVDLINRLRNNHKG